MWEPQPLTTLRASKACRGENFTLLEKKHTDTFEMLKNACGEECIWRTGVFEWHKKFKEGRESLQDDERVRTMLTAF
jgi:hypothetical protein